ncbi:MAG: hypothetical protein NC349_09130 [Paenibacillus sp.]|nr:hypothetical protein [Paenibacillus sp.]
MAKKLTLLTLLVSIALAVAVTACGNISTTKTEKVKGVEVIFSVEEINKEEFERAENSQQKYAYTYFCDSVVENDITRIIVSDVRTRFERMDSSQREDYDIPLGGDEYENLFHTSSLTYAKKLGIYGFMLPTIHDCELHCYNARTGKYLGNIILPFAISPKGIMVAQKQHDCDVPLDLHFYIHSQDYVYENFSFIYNGINGEAVVDYYTSQELELPVTSFFVGDNLLYISLYKVARPTDTDLVYLKITLPDIK